MHHSRTYKRQSAQHEIISIQIIGSLSFDPFNLDFPEARLDGADDTHRNLVLNRENVAQQTIITLGPDMAAGVGTYQLGCNAYPLPGLSPASFYQVTVTQI